MIRWFVFFILVFGMGSGAFCQVSGKPSRFKHKEILLAPVFPTPDTVIPRGEVFFVVEIKKKVKLQTSTVRFFLDNRIISQNVKVTSNKITVLYLTPLAPGRHEVYIEAKELGYEWIPPLTYTFFVDKKFTPLEDSLQKAERRKISISGNIIADTRQTYLSGPGAEQRQEPRVTNTLNANLLLQAGKWSFPIKTFQTSDETTYPFLGPLPRNTWMVGANHKNVELSMGDISPVFDKLALTGLRIRGARLNLLFKRFQLHLLQGYSQRAQEGQLIKFTGIGLPPPTIRPDSTYILPGMFRRDIMALRMVFGSIKEGGALGLNILKGRDNFNSITYGGKPRENLVISLDQQFVTNGNRLKTTAGISHSLTTLDVSQGAVSKRQIDSSVNGNYGFDPIKWQKIHTINFTTARPGYPSFAGYINTVIQPKYHVITLDFRFFGNAYQSFGNPFARADIRSFYLQDQVMIWKRKIQIMARYQYQDNNRSKTEYATIRQQFATGNILFAPGPKFPQLSANFSYQFRKTPDAILSTFMVNDVISNASYNLVYQFKTGKMMSFVNGSLNLNNRKDAINPINNNQLQTISGGIRQSIDKYGLSWDVQYVTTEISDNINGATRLNESFDTRLRWKIKKLKTTLSGGYMRTHLFKNKFTPFDSYRHSITGSISILPVKGLQLDIEGGKSPNRNALMPILNYDEWYVYGRISWQFSQTLRK